MVQLFWHRSVITKTWGLNMTLNPFVEHVFLQRNIVLGHPLKSIIFFIYLVQFILKLQNSHIFLSIFLSQLFLQKLNLSLLQLNNFSLLVFWHWNFMLLVFFGKKILLTLFFNNLKFILETLLKRANLVEIWNMRNFIIGCIWSPDGSC